MLSCGLKLGLGTALATLALWTGIPGVSRQIPKEPVKWSIRVITPDPTLKPGAQFTVELTAGIENGWHLYSLEQEEGGPLPTRIVIPADQPFVAGGTIESAEPKSEMDPNFNLMTHYYEEQAVFSVPVKVAAHAAAGKSEVRINVSFQTCSNELCLPPKTIKLGVEITIVP